MNLIGNNPWVGAAEALNGPANTFAGLYSQIPQVRMRMQQHADDMAIRQGGLQLQQAELTQKAPLVLAQTKNFTAEGNAHQAKADQLQQALALARTVQGASYRGGMTGVPQQGPTLERAQGMERETMLAAMRAVAAMDPASAQRMQDDLTKVVTLNDKESAFSNPAMGQMRPLAMGGNTSPYGSRVLAPTALPGQPEVVNEGQFRPLSINGSTGEVEDPSLVIQRLQGVQGNSLKPVPGLSALINNLVMQSLYNQTNQPQPWMQGQGAGTSDLPRISTKEEHAKLPKGSSYIGPDGKRAVK